MTQNFSMDDIAKLLQATQKKPRKKKELTEEQTIKMKERLATMREKSLQARQAKASKVASNPVIINHDIPVQMPSLEIKRLSEKDHDELFEKKYNSKFEKIDETMGHIKSSIEEIKELKKQKALERQKAKEEKQIETPVEIKQVQHIQQVQQTQPETRFSTKSNALPAQVKTNSLVIPKMPDYKNMFKKYPF